LIYVISLNLPPQAAGTATTFIRDFSPFTNTTSRFAQPSVFARNSHKHELALPSSGAAAMRTHKQLSLMPAISFFDAPGMAFIEMWILFSVV